MMGTRWDGEVWMVGSPQEWVSDIQSGISAELEGSGEGEPLVVVPGTEGGVAATPEAPVETPEGTPAPDPSKPAADPPKEAWYTKRINTLTGHLKEFQEKHTASEARAGKLEQDLQMALEALAAIRDGKTPVLPDTKPTVAVPEGYVPANQVEQAAQQLLQRRQLELKANKAAADGAAEHSDFAQTMTNLGQALGEDVLRIVEPLFTQDDVPYHKVLYALGTDIEKAQRLATLPPAALAIEIYKMAEAAKKPVKKTPLPDPMEPLGGKKAAPSVGSAEPGPDRPYAEWYAWRQKNQGRAA